MASTPPNTATTLRAVLVDDEPLARQELAYLLERSGGVDLVGQGANGIEAVELIRSLRPEIVFLDVQMPGLDGFAVIKRLLEQKVAMPQVVFATAFDQYAVRAFEVNAVDYLLKPFDRKRVLKAVEQARARAALQSQTVLVSPPSDAALGAKLDAMLQLIEERVKQPGPGKAEPEKQLGRIIVRSQNRLLLVDQADVCFAAIGEGAIQIVTNTLEGHTSARTLEELMNQLDPQIFWRTHRSYIVNTRHIREVVPWFNSSYQLRMDDAKRTEIPVSRAQTRRLRELFNL